jgi:NADPH-dependent 2,4-dienoyl-CoA reductase/sulfur reductase-like enzyme
MQNKLNSIDSAEIVIVGNGIAGQTAAIEARRHAPGKRVVMITEQSHPTINTPALKQFAIGKLTREQLLAYPAGTERAQRIHVINARVEEIHAQDSYVCLTGGRGFGYESLLIATGSTATGLPANLPGSDFDGVLTLHHLNDYLDLRRRLSEVDEVVVIGGGPHAIETIMSLLYWGIRANWLIRSDTFLPRMLDRPASDMVLDRVKRAGAKVYTEAKLLGIVGRVGAVAGVVTNQHQLLPCQLVLVCTGTTPVTTLADRCDLPMRHNHGIVVDNQLRTSVRNIYAAGDVAALQDPQTGEYAPRAQWYAAVLQGRIAGAAMTGSEQHEEGFGVPWHATRLGELSMLTVGNPLQWRDTATTLTDSSRGSYRRLSIIDDRLVGYLSLGSSQPDGLAIKRLINEGLSIREIKKALLKGNFDARKYFSRQRTYAAQRMVNTGKLPPPDTVEITRQTQQLMHTPRETGPLAAPGTVSNPIDTKIEVDIDPLLNIDVYHDYTSTNVGITASTESLVNSDNHQYSADRGRSAKNLEDYTHLLRRTDTQQKRDSIPNESEALFFEEGITPTQEMHRLADSARVVESTLITLPSDTSRHPSSSLWSYSAELPAVKMHKGSQSVAPGPIYTINQTSTRSSEKQLLSSAGASGQEEESERLSRAYPSNCLWSSSDKHPAVRKGH